MWLGLNVLKRKLSSTITEKWLNDVTKLRHMSDTGHCMQILFFQNIPPIIFRDFNYDQHDVKTKFKGLKRQVNSQILKKWLNDVSTWRHISDSRHGIQEYFSSKYSPLSHSSTSTMINMSWRTKGLKRQ